MTIGMKTAVGDRPHWVTIENPGPAVPDGDGGFTQIWTAALLGWSVKIAPATAADLEQIAAGTVIAQATHLVTGPYRPDVTTASRIRFGARQFSVTGVSDPEERHVELVCVCVELLDVVAVDAGIDGGDPTSVFAGGFDGGAP